MPLNFDVRLDPPETTLDKLSFTETDVAAINQWVAVLPVVNIEETGQLLRLATAELALLQAPPAAKYDYLEEVRPLLHYVGNRLDRVSFGAVKTTGDSQAQRLLLNLCTGYKGVVLDLVQRLENDEPVSKNLLLQSIHRLLSELSRVLLRAQQLYLQPPPNFWWEVNELYRLAENLNSIHFRFADDENQRNTSLTIQAVYLRSLLLASCKPNQLQQSQLSQVFSALEDWASVVTLTRDNAGALLVIDLQDNLPPRFTADTGVDTAAAAHSEAMNDPRHLHTQLLAYEIEAYLRGIEGRVEVPAQLPQPLLRHLIKAWSQVHPRDYRRFISATRMFVAIGIRDIHYFLSGGHTFKEQLANTETLLRREVNPFLQLTYESPGDIRPLRVQARGTGRSVPGPLEAAQSFAPDPVHECFETHATDASAGGYCIEWGAQLPSNATVGELLAIHEEQAQRWSVAVIRWLRQENRHINMGVELLSPRAIPVALRLIQTRGGATDFVRGLLLPNIPNLRQDASLITPALLFDTRQKLVIQRQGIQSTAQLLQTQRKTESFNQFTFRMLDGYLENLRADRNMSERSSRSSEDTDLES